MSQNEAIDHSQLLTWQWDHSIILSWLQEDIPSFDYGGLVVGMLLLSIANNFRR